MAATTGCVDRAPAAKGQVDTRRVTQFAQTVLHSSTCAPPPPPPGKEVAAAPAATTTRLSPAAGARQLVWPQE